MKLQLELQYAEFHPDQIDKIGMIDFDQALKIIQSYPWERELDKIEERTKRSLTSTVPNVSIRNKENELLIISTRDNNNFIIELLTSTHHGEQIIPINSFDNKLGLTTENVVAKFFEGSIKEVFKLNPIAPVEARDISVYRLAEYPVFISGLTAGILTLILIMDIWGNGFTPKALPAVYFVGMIVVMIGLPSIVTVQYILHDWGKEVSLENGSLIIRQKGNQAKIMKGDLEEIAVIENDNNRYLRNYKYARIKTKDGKVFVVTSFVIDPMDIVNKLKVNHKEEGVFLPTINLDIQSEKKKEKALRQNEKKKIEFLENFKNYEDSKLRQIVGDRKSYEDYAVKAATEILEQRKSRRND